MRACLHCALARALGDEADELVRLLMGGKPVYVAREEEAETSLGSTAE